MKAKTKELQTDCENRTNTELNIPGVEWNNVSLVQGIYDYGWYKSLQYMHGSTAQDGQIDYIQDTTTNDLTTKATSLLGDYTIVQTKK